MVSRRQAVTEFLLGVGALVVRVWSRRVQRRREDIQDPPDTSLVGVIVGTGWQIAYLTAHDRDVGRIASSRLRQAGYVAGAVIVRRRLFTDAFEEGFNAGELVGLVLYRLWNGIVREP